jgi:hypothetical protein
MHLDSISCTCYNGVVNFDIANETDAILRDVAERLKELDVPKLQNEIGTIQLELNELNRQMQERHVLLQVRQLQAQRRAERASGLGTRSQWRPDRDVQRRLDDIYRATDSLDDQVIQGEIGKLQAELQRVNRQIQERQHVLGLKQMLSQGMESGGGNGFPMQFLQAGVGFQVGMIQPTVSSGGSGVPHVDAATKRQAILEVMREQPGRPWKPAEIKRVLGLRGMQNADDGTPIRNLLWKMQQDGLLERPAAGAYQLPGGDPRSD